MADALAASAFRDLDARLRRDVTAPVAVGVSGGSDSLALLRLASAWCAGAGRPLLALTVDHGLSPHAAAWTAFARTRACEAGAAFRILRWAGPKPRSGLPAAARAARHALLADAAREAGARVVLLGHTADDVAEGERMRADGAAGLGRLRAWAPSPAWPQGRGVFLLRPLLALSRAELRAWLVRSGEGDWIEDPANADPRFARARARAAGGLALGPVPASEPSEEAAALAAAVQADASGRLAWPRARWSQASRPAQARVLAAAAVCAGGGGRIPRAQAVERAADAIRKGAASSTLCGARILPGADMVAVTRAAPRAAADAPFEAAGVWDGRFEVGLDAPGWRFVRLAGLAARLPEAERRALRAVPAEARPALPTLVDAQGAPRLPRPFGGGPGEARSLVAERLRAACGGIRREADLG